MGNLSTHFDSSEFLCECCGRSKTMSKLLINRLEKMFVIMDAKAIFINSGYRCENNPWGYKTDAHRKGIAADIKVQKKDGSWYASQDIAEVAERLGFGGIGMMLPISCHVDTRDSEPYANNHWFGNETTGNDNIKTFQRGTVFAGEKSNSNASGSEKIKELQRILNSKGSRLDVDGICGKLTIAELKKYSIEQGDKGTLTKWVQEVLNIKGFNCGSADGICGAKTIKALNDWQRANGLGVGKFYGTDWEHFVKGI